MAGIMAHHSETLFFGFPDNSLILDVNVVDGEFYNIGTDVSGIYNGHIDWGDGSPVEPFNSWDHPALTNHQAQTTGKVRVKVKGTFSSFRPSGGCALDGLEAVVNLGSVGWSNLTEAFAEKSNLISVTIGDADTSGVSSMQGMFRGCSTLTTLDVSGFDTGSMSLMQNMFKDCSALTTLDASTWNTSGVSSMQTMFSGCSALTTLDASTWDTSSVSSMNSMFYNCNALTTLDVSTWDTSSASLMQGMFYGCSALTALDVSTWDTSGVSSMQTMFSGCSALTALDISTWNTSAVTNMQGMFSFCSALRLLGLTGVSTVYLQVPNVLSFDNMFRSTTLAVVQYSYLLEQFGLSQNTPVKSGRNFNGGGSQYNASGAIGRTALTNAPNFWTIIDGGPES